MRLTYTLTLFCVLLTLSSCKLKKSNSNELSEVVNIDLPEIQERGELNVATMYSSIDYFQYRGQSMGVQHDLSEQFATSLDLALNIKVANSELELIRMLNSGEVDLIAYPLPVTKEWKDSLAYCGAEALMHQVIIQQKVKGEEPLRDVTELIGKEVHVQPGKYYERLKNLNDELGGGIHIQLIEADTVTLEDLIQQVSEGQIGYTVAYNDIAKLNKTYFPNIDIDLKISFDQKTYWGVRKESVVLEKAVNEWYINNSSSPQYTASLKRYFEISKNSYIHSPIQSIEEGIISPYDNYFKKYAQTINWDWRLLASLAYTESNFKKNSVSWAGALGLMQLMPRTARAMGVPAGKELDVEENIKGAVKYIRVTEKSFSEILNVDERIKFVLAAYNAGSGHIFDAMALAEKYHRDPMIWLNSVENYLLLKSKRKFFSDPVCKYGYFRGIETYNFVRDIVARYDVYKEKVPL